MKLKVALAIFIALQVAEFQISAAVSSLPIGSVEKVLNHELKNTHQIVINIQWGNSVEDIDNWNVSFLFMDSYRSYTKTDETIESVNDLCQRSASTSDKLELKILLRGIMREAVRVYVDPNDPALQEKVIAVLIGGDWNPDPNNYEQTVGTFSVENTFVLGALKDAQGKTIIPDSAYDVDLERAIGVGRSGWSRGLFVGNIVRGEIKDEQGNTLASKLAISRSSNQAITFNNSFLFGQQTGTVQLWYVDGSTQVFSLADGSLLSPLPVLTVTLASQTTLRVTVSNLLAGPVTIRYSENLKDWNTLSVLTSTTGSVEVNDTIAGQARFYRACPGIEP